MARVRFRRGAVLIVVLAVLAVLSLLGTSFVVLQSLERSVSRNYVDEVRAKMAARSGVSAAVSSLEVSPFSPTLKYWGNDYNENGQVDPGESVDGAASLETVGLEWATHPSMAVRPDGQAGARPSQIAVKGADGKVRKIGYSGAHTGTSYPDGMDIYQVRISDLSGRIYVNDGVTLHGGNQSSVSQNLRRILNVLGRLPTVRVQGLGDRLLDKRPTTGFGSVEDLSAILNPQELRRVEPFITMHAWVDKNVVNPVPLSSAVAHEYPVRYWRGEEALYRQGRGRTATGGLVSGALRWFDGADTNSEHCAIFALDELAPQYIEVSHRAPVNVNAASREVLTTLIADVKGFFVSERRSFAPYAPSPTVAVQDGVSIPQQYYSWWTVRHSYDSNGTDADAYGYLYTTQSLAAPSEGGETTVAAGPSAGSAQLVADHIIACREKRDLGAIQYSKAEYRGPFRTWAQFNRFIDGLVENRVIEDQRAVFMDYVPSMGAWDQLRAAPSAAGKRFASYALGDALKANFNPNMHLNESNPEANLYLRVDKTDLIVNSTEFTFQPTGFYQVESLGRILRRVGSGGTSDASMHRIIAEKRILAEVRAFEMYRETSQRHFYRGKFDEKAGMTPTNSGYAMELGPEADNGLNLYGDRYGDYVGTLTPEMDGFLGYPPGTTSIATGWGYEYDGYLQLSTLGGDGAVSGKGRRVKTEANNPTWPIDGTINGKQYLTMVGHFQHDFDLSYSATGDRRELASIEDNGLGEKTSNHADLEGFPSGPYGPATGDRTVHRLARSFRLPPNTGRSTGTQTAAPLPFLRKFPVSDLRIDGAYTERNSGLAYLMKQDKMEDGTTAVPNTNFTMHGGALSMWVKPSFFPEHTGKIRNLWSASAFHQNGSYRNPAPFNLMYMPSHDMPGYVAPTACALGTKGGGQYSGTTCSSCRYREDFTGILYGVNDDIASQKKHVEKRPGGWGVNQFPPSCFVAMRAATSADIGTGGPSDGYPPYVNYDIENYAVTSCLNHNLHEHGVDTGTTPNSTVPSDTLRPNYLEAHRWTHVVVGWRVIPPF